MDERRVFEIKEPVYGHPIQIMMIPLEDLKVIEIQRRPSSSHTKRLAESMRKLGFVVPVVVIRKDERFIIIDGQHRYLAAKELGAKEIPCVVIDKKYGFELMELNIEKQMTLRERCYVALNVYRWYIQIDDTKMEDDQEIQDSIEFPYYVTLGIAYEKEKRFFGSAYESILRRIDAFLELPISEAIRNRTERADLLLQTEEQVREAVALIKEKGISHPFLHKELVSFANPLGKRRLVRESYENVLSALQDNIQRVIKAPERFISRLPQGEP